MRSRFMIFPFKTMGLLRWLFPHFTWRIQTNSPEVYLTFDDGPIPNVTEWVLDILQEYGVKATFFCVGDNIRKHPLVFERVLNEGHRAGNHTFNHWSGWKYDTASYMENVAMCQQEMERFPTFYEQLQHTKPLFRPPYGRIKKSQAVAVRQQYQIVMWDVLSGDFAKSINEEICLQKTVQYTEPGSIIVFHDSVKTEKKLRMVLPNFLQEMLAHGYTFKLL